jgi:hypothetical protein
LITLLLLVGVAVVRGIILLITEVVVVLVGSELVQVYL